MDKRPGCVFQDHVYFNLRDHNDSKVKDKECSPIQRQLKPLLDIPEEYAMSVVRFEIPTDKIPIFVFEDNTYYVTLSYGPNDYTKVVNFRQTNMTDPNDREIYQIDMFIAEINIALAAAYLDLAAANPGIVTTEAPFFIYDPPTQLISLIAEEQYLTHATPTFIWVNTPLYAKLSTLPNEFHGYSAQYKNYKLLLTDLRNNKGFFQNPLNPPPIAGGGGTGPVYLKMQQQTISIGNLSNVQSIIFTSNNIPSQPEAVSSSSGEYRKIITDFDIPRSSTDIPNNSPFLQYFPQGPLRMIDLEGKTALSTIDIQVFWSDNKGKLFPVKLSPGSTFTCKLLFQKKTCIN